MTATLIIAAGGAKYLWLLYLWLLSAISASALSRSKGYGDKAGLGTGLLLTVLGPIIWLFIPPKDENAEWHKRKPWQLRRKPTEAEMQATMEAGATTGSSAGTGEDAGAGSRGGESRA
jgi:hypothetical protein